MDRDSCVPERRSVDLYLLGYLLRELFQFLFSLSWPSHEFSNLELFDEFPHVHSLWRLPDVGLTLPGSKMFIKLFVFLHCFQFKKITRFAFGNFELTAVLYLLNAPCLHSDLMLRVGCQLIDRTFHIKGIMSYRNL